MTKQHGGTLVIQAYPGIGDMIWFLPYLRALARQSPDHKVTVLTKSRSFAKEWLIHDPVIKDIMYVERNGLWQAIAEVRKRKFQTAWVLHRSFSYAMLAFFGRIPKRYGLGIYTQKYLLNAEKTLTSEEQKLHILEQLKALMAAHHIEVKANDFYLPVAEADLTQMEEKFSIYPKPWFFMGVGASESFKCWPLSYFADLGVRLAQQKGTVFVCGAAHEARQIHWIIDEMKEGGATAVAVTDLSLPQSFALLSKGTAFIGNDSALLNAAAMLGIHAIGLFGVTSPLNYVPNLHALKPPSSSILPQDAMTEISVEAVWHKLQELSCL